MTLTLLPTDILLWVLFFLGALFTGFILSKPYLRTPWKKVFYRPIYLASSLVLVVFFSIALLDSIHFTISEEGKADRTNVSVLDLVLKPAQSGSESSYSAPFATHLFVKEVMEVDGELVRDYPRLKHAGVHLDSMDERGPEIKRIVWTSLIQSLIFTLVICIMIGFVVTMTAKISFETYFAQVLTNRASFPWKTLFVSIWAFLWLAIMVDTFMPLYHILGTSKIGEDVFYQAMKSIRTGVVIGTITTLFMLPFAIILGMMAGFYRGWVDDVIQYLYTTLSSIPGVLLIAAAVLTLQAFIGTHESWFETQAQRSDARLLALCVILGVTSWTGLCRLLRAETLKLRNIEYVQAATVLGVSKIKTLFMHLLPNVLHIILIAIALDFSGLVLAEAVLSYVGVGVDPASYSWGTMINSARLEMARAPIVWWSLAGAFVFMFVLVLSANLFADAVRDAFDPRV